MGRQPPQQYIQLRQSHSASKIRISLMWDSLPGVSQLFRWNCLRLAWQQVWSTWSAVCTISGGIWEIRGDSMWAVTGHWRGRGRGREGKCCVRPTVTSLAWGGCEGRTEQNKSVSKCKCVKFSKIKSSPNKAKQSPAAHSINSFLRSWIRVLKRLNTGGEPDPVFVLDLTLCSMIETARRCWRED